MDVRLTSEQQQLRDAAAKLADDLPLFSTAVPAPAKSNPSAAEERLKNLNPDSLSPRDALDLLYELKKLASV